MAKKNITINNVSLNVEAQTLTLSFVTYDTNSGKSEYGPKRIAIDNQTTFECKNNESPNATKINIDSNDVDMSLTPVSGYYEYTVNKAFDLSDALLTLDTDLMFVYIYSNDTNNTNEYLEAVVPVYNEQTLYNKVFDIIKKDFSGCNTLCKENNNSSINAILALKGLEYALVTGDYRKAVDFWNIINSTSSTVTNHCNCN